jgi:hypothetical protein
MSMDGTSEATIESKEKSNRRFLPPSRSAPHSGDKDYAETVSDGTVAATNAGRSADKSAEANASVREVWAGPYYELVSRLGPRSDARLEAAVEAFWALEGLHGPYRHARGEEPLTVTESVAVERGGYGTLELAGALLPVSLFLFKDAAADLDLLDISFPLEVLEEVYGFAYQEWDLTGSWVEAVDAWLVAAARAIHAVAPFEYALLGDEPSVAGVTAEISGLELSADYRGALIPAAGGTLLFTPHAELTSK